MLGPVTIRLERRGFLAVGAVLLALAFAAPPSGAADCDGYVGEAAAFWSAVSEDGLRACVSAHGVVAKDEEYGGTPLHWAASNSVKPGAIAVLLDAGADPNARDVEGLAPLHWAASDSIEPDVLAALLAAGADPNARGGEHGVTPLHWAAQRPGSDLFLWAELDWMPGWLAERLGELFLEPRDSTSSALSVLAVLLDGGADPNARDADGWTALHHATAFAGDPAVTKALLEDGADPSARDDEGLEPLHFAALNSDGPGAIAALLAAGADPNARDEYGVTPLHWAAQRPGSGLFLGADLDGLPGWLVERLGELLLEPRDSSSPTLSVLTVLLDGGADPNARDADGETALHLAVRRKEIAPLFDNEALRWYRRGMPEVLDELVIVEVLLKAGADPNERDLDGWSPLHLAAKHVIDPAVVEALLEAGANIGARGGRHDAAPLHMAAAHATDPAVAMTLLDAGADPNARTKLGMTPLHMAAARATDPAIAMALLDAGADIEARADVNATPLHVAMARATDPTVAIALVEAGADPNARADAGLTPLHWGVAMSTSDPAVAMALVEAGADPNARADGGLTPLHWAAMLATDPAVAMALLEAGADPEARDAEGRSAWDLARTNEALRDTAFYERLRALVGD